MTTKRTWVVENKWKCTSCNAENLGRYTECQNCRSAKEKDEADSLSGPGAPAVTDPELLRLANQGANWVCEFCGGQVRNEHNRCVKNCGAPREEPKVEVNTTDGRISVKATGGAQAVGLNVDEDGVKIRTSNGGKVTNLVVNGRKVVDDEGNYIPKSPAKTYVPSPFGDVSTGQRVGIAAAIVGVLGFVGLMIYLFAPWEVDAKVVSISWSYRSDLRQRVQKHTEDWKSDMKSGAFNVTCESKYYDTEDCNPHQCRPHSVSYECNCSSYECNCQQSCTDNKNGFSTCSETCSTCQRCSTCSRTEYDTCYDQCPVYKPWCSYDYYEWPVIQTLTTSGVTHDEHWPVLEAKGEEQKLDRTENYAVTFIDVKNSKESWEVAPRSLGEFQQFEPAQVWRLKVNRLRQATPLRKEP